MLQQRGALSSHTDAAAAYAARDSVLPSKQVCFICVVLAECLIFRKVWGRATNRGLTNFMHLVVAQKDMSFVANPNNLLGLNI